VLDLDAEVSLAARLRERLYVECDADQIVSEGPRASSRIRDLARQFLAEERRILSPDRMDRVLDHVVAATTGLGPLQSLLDDPGVSEIMVNGPAAVYVERHGRVSRVDARFVDDEHVRQVIDRILAPIGRRVDALAPMVDARLPDGSRVNAIVPPLALEGPAVTIRKFLPTARTMADLVELGGMSAAGRQVVLELIEQRANVLVAGPTSSGKTTLLAAALAECAAEDRIVVIEDSAELPLTHEHRVRLESRPATFEGSGAVTVRDLVRNALRMRPDRIIIGEVRGGESFDMVQALSTGHRGCWSTVHANGAHDALLRLESMALCAGVAIPQHVLRAQIARAVNAVAFVDRDAAGVRRLHSIVDVVPDEGGWELVDRLAAA
jgi:pilus assembly protein CpaF